MECIICKGVGEEPLKDNTNCSCKYKRHNSCWIDYVHSTDKVKCILCRKEVKAKKAPPRPPTPTAPLLAQEDIIIIPEETPAPQQGGNMKPLEKILKIALVLILIAVILLIVKLFLF